MQRMVGEKSKVGWDVMRVANVGRMGVLWTFYLLYSYVLLLLLHQKPNSHRPQLPPSHVKRACIVTGASSGIGKATALALALRGFHVILASRSLKLLQEVKSEIELQHPGTSCQALELDLSDVGSILKFSRTVRELFEGDDSPGTLQLLVNNAGILAASQRWTSDGYDHMIASNYLGPFMLTQQLLPLLEKSAPHARIVNVVSFTHRCVRSLQIEKDQLVKGTLQIPLSRSYYALAQIYETSKLCLLLFSYELHRRYSCKKSASRISVIAADPGAVSTSIMRELPSWLVQLSNIVLTLLGVLQAPSGGASSVVAAAGLLMKFLVNIFLEIRVRLVHPRVSHMTSTSPVSSGRPQHQSSETHSADTRCSRIVSSKRIAVVDALITMMFCSSLEILANVSYKAGIWSHNCTRLHP